MAKRRIYGDGHSRCVCTYKTTERSPANGLHASGEAQAETEKVGAAAAFTCLAGHVSRRLHVSREQQQPGSGYRESVKRVQAAVDDYQEQKGLLPILTSDQTTPRYEKFVIDLNKLQQEGYLDEIPAAAFEKAAAPISWC